MRARNYVSAGARRSSVDCSLFNVEYFLVFFLCLMFDVQCVWMVPPKVLNCMVLPWKAGNYYLGLGSGNVFVLLGRRFSDGATGVQGEDFSARVFLGQHPPIVTWGLTKAVLLLSLSSNRHARATTEACPMGTPGQT